MNSQPEQTHFTSTLRALAHGGAAVGEVSACASNPELIGKTSFIPLCIPGEEVEAKLDADHKNYVEGSLIKINSPSPFRIPAPCPYFGECGGCNLQHIELEAQRNFKLDMVQGYLQRHAGVQDMSGVTLDGSDLAGFAYRKRVILHVNREGQVGFYHKKTKRILEVDICLIAVPEINQTLKVLTSSMKEFGGIVDDIVVEFVDGQLFVELKLRPRLKNGKQGEFAVILATLLKDQFPNLTVSFHAIPLFVSHNGTEIKAEEQEFPVGHFSQVNDAGNALLQKLVLEFCADAQEITELFAGAGNFSFPLARQASKVVAVEADRALVRYGILMAEKLGLSDRIEFVRKSCEKYVRKYPLLPCLVIDPPRCGAQEVAEKVDPIITKRIVYVSCALPTLCRDIKILSDKGYVLEQTRVIDMFPQTHHVETVSLLTHA